MASREPDPTDDLGRAVEVDVAAVGAAYRLSVMAVNVLAVADRVAGAGIKRLTSAHHVRRLGKLGGARRSLRLRMMGACGRRSDPPPRAGNAIEVLIDGAAYSPRSSRRSGPRGARAHRRVVIDAGAAVIRGPPPVVLRELLGEVAGPVDVRVLLWAGAPVPVFRPAPVGARGRDELVRGTRIKAALDSHERPMHCHHEKMVVIDGEVAFVGGIDLTDLGGDRYDTPGTRGVDGWAGTTSPRGCAVR